MKKDIKTKEGILAGLNNQSRQEYLYKEYLEAESKFKDSLKDLKNFGEVCDCEEPKEALVIEASEGNYVGKYDCSEKCLVCGGEIKEEEGYY